MQNRQIHRSRPVLARGRGGGDGVRRGAGFPFQGDEVFWDWTVLGGDGCTTL